MIKYIIKEPRPTNREHMYVEFGMPSSHRSENRFFFCLTLIQLELIYFSSQFMFFFSTYTLLFVLKRLHYNSPLEKIIRIIVITICGVATALVCYGRVYLQYHTVSQVVYGSLVGIFTGIAWFLVVHLLLTPFFPIIVSWWVHHSSITPIDRETLYFIRNLNFIRSLFRLTHLIVKIDENREKKVFLAHKNIKTFPTYFSGKFRNCYC
jgi:membrane-associated phospholipid phosphatase